MTTNDFSTCLEVACNAAKAAGAIVNLYRKKNLTIHTKMLDVSLASQVVTEADIASQNEILKFIEPVALKYKHAILAEESEDSKERFEKDYFWCIDPLDGTLPFSEGRDGFSVSIALVRKDGVPVIGVVYQPWSGDLYYAVKGQGAHKNKQPLQVATSGCSDTLHLYSDRGFDSHPDFNSLYSYYDSKYPANQILYRGGAVTHALCALEDPWGMYYKLPKKQLGGGSLWDYSATACIMREAGGYASDAMGNQLPLNKKNSLFMNDCGIIFASSIEVFEYMKRFLPDYYTQH